MNCKKGHKQPKKLPYGATKGKFWCGVCDVVEVSSWTKPIKKRERQNAKKEIKKQKEEM